MLDIFSAGSKETKKVAHALAKELSSCAGHSARVVALEGNLGSGKTTFSQGFAKALGIKERVLSPTFVLMKVYALSRRTKKSFRHLIHIDCYRLGSPRELLALGFRELLKDSGAIILIEWADRVKKILPKSTIRARFSYGKKPNERLISLTSK